MDLLPEEATRLRKTLEWVTGRSVPLNENYSDTIQEAYDRVQQFKDMKISTLDDLLFNRSIGR